MVRVVGVEVLNPLITVRKAAPLTVNRPDPEPMVLLEFPLWMNLAPPPPPMLSELVAVS